MLVLESQRFRFACLLEQQEARHHAQSVQLTPRYTARVVGEMSMAREIEDFGALARSWQRFFAIRVRVALALREEDGWHLWYSYTAFLADLPSNPEPLSVETRSIRAIRDFTSLSTTTEAELAVSEMLEKPGVLTTAAWTADLAPSNPHLTFEYEPLHPSRLAGNSRLPALTAHWHNPQYQTLVSTKELDQELQLHESPYDGLADLTAALNIPVGLDDLNRRRFSEFVLIPPVELLFHLANDPHSELRDGELSVVLKAHPGVSTDKIKVGVKAFRQAGAPDRLTIDGESISRDEQGFLRVKRKLPSAGVPLVQVFVSMEGEMIGKWWVRDFGKSFNDRMLLHRTIDVDDKLKATFFDKPDQFEDKVLLLLTLMGFTALKYGAIQTDAPDILAISPARHVFVIECTTGDINRKGKLQMLSDRTKLVRERMQKSSNPPVGVVPVMFTSLLREETSMHWDTAAVFGIALVARENIVSTIDQLDAAISPDQVYSVTLSLIPSKKPEPTT